MAAKGARVLRSAPKLKVVPPGKVDKPWFVDQFKKSNLTQNRFAKAINLDPGAVSRILSGDKRLQIHEATILAGLLSQPLEEVLARAGVKVGRGIPIQGYIDGKLSVHWVKNGGSSLGFAPVPLFADREALHAFRFQTAGSRYDSQDSGLVYFRDTGEGVSPDALGKLCVVRLLEAPDRGQEWALRVVRRGYEAGTHNLSPMFSGEPSEINQEIRSAFPILWMKL